MTLYLGESAGARILQFGVGISQIGDNYQASFETWDVLPAGEMGDCIFRSLGVSFAYDNGYAIGITPIVDGIALGEATFTGSGSSVNGQAQYFFAQRGTRLACQVRTLSRNGNLRWYNVQWSGAVLRVWP